MLCKTTRNGRKSMSDLKKENAKVISITDIEGIQIGQVENVEAGTGCTAFLCPDGMRAGLDVRLPQRPGSLP